MKAATRYTIIVWWAWNRWGRSVSTKFERVEDLAWRKYVDGRRP